MKKLAIRLASWLAASGVLALSGRPAEALAVVPPALPGFAIEYAQPRHPVRSVIDWSRAELVRAIPELRKLEPPRSPEEAQNLLPAIL